MPNPDEIQKIITTKERRLTILRQQAAALGINYAPPHILIEIQDLEIEIAALYRQAGLTPPPPLPNTLPHSTPTHSTINCEPVITLFQQMMRPASAHRIMRLWGEAKLGKSHLLTKVFPLLARETYHALYVVVDLRNSNVTVPDILHQTCAQLGGETRFPAYYAAYDAWLNQPVKQVKGGLKDMFSSLSTRTAEPDADPRRVERQLTTKFVADLARLSPLAILLMFDALEQSSNTIQDWLMDELLVSLNPLEHVRVVVAGRAIPKAAGSYVACCHSYELTPVRDEAAYITYCRHLQLNLEEQLIKGFAYLLDYKPGLFVDMVLPKYGQTGAAHD